jgi:gliding motility-associated-like protein
LRLPSPPHLFPLRIVAAIVLFICFSSFSNAHAQCSAAFPYYESFQSNNGGWMPGGVNSDWEWGDLKTSMGRRAWSTGGLSKTSYSDGQNSWLQSPCFNFTSLVNPQISFNVFWETERQFDGASFQYSINNGNTWITVGSSSDAPNCFTANWFNSTAITYQGGRPGWSGSIKPTSGSCLGGNGSNGWRLAKHDLSVLAGQPQVIFRFTFGSGTACNNYDGFAIDDILINDRAVNVADFGYTCGANNTISFVNTSSVCAQSYSWNFGDPTSGTQNVNTAKDPDHTFSAPGTYNVSLTVVFADNSTLTTTKTVTVLGTSFNVTHVKCYGDSTGAATVNLTGGNGNYTYLWNTDPPQTIATASMLKAATYQVAVGMPGGCTTIGYINIAQPEQLRNTLSVVDEKCSNNQGSVTANVQGGVQPYTYQWNNGSTAASLQQIGAGNYSLQVTDANGCTLSSTASVKNIVNPINLFLGNDTTVCAGEKVTLNAGNFSSYIWQDGSSGSTFTVTNTGRYSVMVTDADGCTATDVIEVTVDCSDIVFPSAFTPNNDGLNDLFGAAGSTGLIRNYSLKIFSRWAGIVFETKDPSRKWDGRVDGIPANTGTFIWMATYELLGKPRVQKGTLTLIR